MPGERPAAFAVTLMLPGMEPVLRVTVSHELSELAVKRLPIVPLIWTDCEAGVPDPAERLKLKVCGLVVIVAPESVMVTGTASWVPLLRLEI